MQTNDAHEYTDEQLQAAIDAAFTSKLPNQTRLLSTDPSVMGSYWDEDEPNRLAIARAFLAALPKPAEPDPYARLKVYNEVGAKIRSYSVMKGEWSEWRINVPWVWCLPFNFYEVHPDDLHMVPEYAPKAETHAKKGAELMGKAMKFEAQPWTLPAPPAGHRWHREDWTQDMLPEGYRPLLEGEVIDKEDEFCYKGIWEKYNIRTSSSVWIGWPCLAHYTHHRTRRPLPAEASAEPEKADDGPPWIPHDGRPCPLKDEEVEEWEYRTRNGALMTGVKAWKPSLRRWKHISDTDDIMEYRVTKPAPGHGPQAASKVSSDTFEAHGKVWTRHTPGDPCPCDSNTTLEFVLRDGSEGEGRSNIANWGKIPGAAGLEIIGWRYADEPAQAEAVPAEEKKTTITGPSDKMLPPLDEAAPIGHCAAAAAYVHRNLDEFGVPRERHGKTFTLWGRVEEYAASRAKPEPAQPWTPSPGDVVRLKSGGPEMTVSFCGIDGSVNCDWFDDIGHPYSKSFPATSLTPAKEGQP